MSSLLAGCLLQALLSLLFVILFSYFLLSPLLFSSVSSFFIYFVSFYCLFVYLLFYFLLFVRLSLSLENPLPAIVNL